MKQTTRSILEEISTAAPGSTRKNIVESKSQHVLESAINIVQEFYKVYTKEEAVDLHKKFINSLKSLDSKKFYRSLARKDET
tara:strand:+ start:929 stop:1174 length:246 start_codon:yes stop_codon:yes gene_type:complete